MEMFFITLFLSIFIRFLWSQNFTKKLLVHNNIIIKCMPEHDLKNLSFLRCFTMRMAVLKVLPQMMLESTKMVPQRC